MDVDLLRSTWKHADRMDMKVTCWDCEVRA